MRSKAEHFFHNYYFLRGEKEKMGKKDRIVITVTMVERTFRSFAVFDQLVRRKAWRKPAAFFAAFVILAIIAFASGKEQSGLLGGVLLAVGIILPAVYLGTFLRQVHEQAVKQGLKEPKKVYTVTLGEDGFTADNEKNEHVFVPWSEDGLTAYRKKGCIYLYTGWGKAFLLPDGQADAADEEVRAFLAKHLGEERWRE